MFSFLLAEVDSMSTNQIKPTDIQVMGVIYSRMQVEFTTLPDEDTQLFFNSKINRSNKPAVTGSEKWCSQNYMICAIRCETPLVLYWNITILLFPLLKRTLIQ